MQKRIEFDANSLLKLLVHYGQDLEDRVPLDATLLAAGVNPMLQRYVMLEVESEHEWRDVPVAPNGELMPLQFRYEGRKTASWGADPSSPMVWQDSIESPTG